MSEDDTTRIASYFARHEVDKATHTHKRADDADSSAGCIGWLLWGDETKRKIDDA